MSLTVLPEVESLTESTELTEHSNLLEVTNNEFLEAIFTDLPDELCPMVVSFHGKPSNGSWGGRAWAPTSLKLSSTFNNYFSISVFRADEKGSYRRRKALFHSCWCVMLDDIGSDKVKVQQLPLAPSWLIETSDKNFQAGYIFADPVVDIAVVESLMDAIVDAGYCDPGAKGPAARLARLPVATNGKYDPEFSCRLAEWNPDLRYTVDEIADGLGLSLTVSKPKGGQSSKQKRFGTMSTSATQGNSVWTPKPVVNPVVEALKKDGIYKGRIDDLRHDITCPWVHEHTNSVDSGTAYFEPSEEYKTGGFSCLHGHCDNKSIVDLLEHYGISEREAQNQAQIRLIEGFLHKVVDAIERELAVHGRYFQRNNKVVTIQTDPATKSSTLVAVEQDQLALALSSQVNWVRFDKRTEGWVQKDPPYRSIRTFLVSGDYNHLPVLKGLAHQPYLRPDGSICVDAGYDPVSQMYGVFSPEDYSVSGEPTKQDAVSALELLMEVLAEFPFESVSDMSAALSALLTAVLRPSLPTAPMFHVKAIVPGTGKSYLCSIITAFASSGEGQPASFPKDEEECRKLLLAELMSAPPVLEFDNLTSDMKPHISLCTVLTSQTFKDRVLSTSTSATVTTRTLFLSSGNNVGPIQDMTRRCVTINLAGNDENPVGREFNNPNILGDVRKYRGVYVSAALTIVRAWIEADRPCEQLTPLNSFGDWSDLCRQPLVWLGYPDPATRIFENLHDDPDKVLLGRILQLWRDLFNGKALKVRQVKQQLKVMGESGEQLFEALEDIAGGENQGINSRLLGRWLGKNQGRIVNGLCFRRANSSSNGDTWAVQKK